MAQIVKSTPHLPPTTSSNGGVIAPNTRGVVGGNRKKQKRRAKLAARQAEQGLVEPNQTAEISARNGQVPQGESTISYHQPSDAQAEYDDPDYDDPNNFDPQERLDEYYSEDEEDAYRNDYASPNGAYAGAPEPSTSRRKNKKKRRSTQGRSQSYNGHGLDDFSAVRSPPPPPMSAAALRSVQRSAKQDRIWNTSTQEERERIKEFWLQLSEEERKSLLKIEKEAVLRKMKEQQKHACSCTVCGRKRTAIEEELEVLYDAYYEELEQYANHQHPGEPGDSIIPPPRGFPQPTNHMRPNSAVPLPLSTGNPQHRTSRVHEILDEGEAEFSDEEDEYSDEEDDDEDDDELYSDEEEPDEEIPVNMGVDFFNFGNSLTVKGGILTVADDLLKNDGKKFIEMMEQLAERRMRREQEAEYAASQPSHGYANGGHELEDDEYDEDEEEYDSQDEYDDEEEEDEMVPSDHMPSGTVSQANHSQSGLTEDDRMREGRRMFQIFAARMFEQRVLTAYREKVAAERQQKLLEELEDESRLDAQREAKKARDAEKKKSKKLAQKQAKAEEKAKREAEKAAEEAAAKAAEEKKLEEQRRKKEEQRKKKEAERKAQEEERQRKEAERLKRQNEEKERQQEAERKAREQKAQEKRQREEARKKELEEKQVREKEAREKKVQEEKEKKQRDAKAKAEKEAMEREKKEQQQPPQPPQIVKRPSQAGMVAVPPGLHPKQSSSSFSSPHVSVATPALPKAPTPARPRQGSRQHSHGTSPKTPNVSTGASKTTSPIGAGAPGSQQPAVTPKTILQKPQNQQPPIVHHPQPTSPINMNHIHPPPPGMPHPPHHNHGFGGGFPPVGFSSFPNPSAPMMHAMNQRQQMPMYPQQGPIGGQFGGPFHPSNGMRGPPPGMNGLGLLPHGRGFSMDAPPGFPQQMPPVGPPGVTPGFGVIRDTMPSHSRQHSASDKSGLETVNPSFPAQPIGPPPRPIQRPSSVKPHEGSQERKQSGDPDTDALTKHLGSSALNDDAEPEPLSAVEPRRQSTVVPPGMSRPIGFGSPMYPPGQPRMDSFGNPSSSWNSPSMTFGPPGLSGPQSWGSGLNTPGWPPANAFGPLGGPTRPSNANRPLAIRRAVCDACKQLNATKTNLNSSDNYHDIHALLRQMDVSRSLAALDAPPTLKEIEDICETEGDAQNGGGLLHVRHQGGEGVFAVKFEPDAATPSAPTHVGEIGSPMPGNSMPALGPRFGSLGAMASPGF